MDDPDLKLLFGAIILIVFGVMGWTYRDQLFGEPEPEPVIAAPAPTEAATFGPAIESLLVREAVIDRLVTTVDNLPRRELSEKIRPVGRLRESFATDAGDDDAVILGISNYVRYEALVAQLYYADLDKVYDTYQRFYPLFQKSYERLGYPDAYFNDRLVEVIDHLVAAPVPEGPIVLVRPNVLYEFADPDLEALSSGEKLLLRMGPSNAGTIKRMLGKFRTQLTEAN
jgi:hypothetical protein